MCALREILADVRTHLDIEIQAGRRLQPIDPQIAAALTGSFAKPELPAPARKAPGSPQTGALERTSQAKHSVSQETPAQPGPSPAEAAASAQNLDAVAAAIARCRMCELAATRTRAVPGCGAASSPDVMFVGEAPGQEEDQRGEPFVGRSGKLLEKMILAMGFTRSDVFIANVIKCRPPGNRTPTAQEMAHCLPFLLRQISLVRPKLLVALGATAYKGLTGNTTANISNIRGLWTSFQGIPLMPTFHPAYLLRAPAAKRVVWEDLKKVLAKLGREPPPVQKQ